MAVLTRLPYCPDLYRYARRKTRTVMVGKVEIGGDNPIRLQSMTTTDTLDVEATAQQALRMAQAGCELIRITAPTVEDSRALGKIKSRLLQLGVDAPIVADIHFQPLAAMEAAEWVEKVRINPGNFVDNKRFAVKEYTDAEYAAELERIEERFTPLVEKLKRLKRALRIGTNHGSLSDRIMNRYGDSPLGMVESALEFTAICEKNGYRDIIFSMKASNPKVMIEAYRLLAARLAEGGRDYPFHLGVTEAGDGEDGRIKSAIGIGSLLEDGIGDTIRVSLTEDPEYEIPVCAALVKPFASGTAAEAKPSSQAEESPIDSFSYARKKTRAFSIGPFLTGGPQLVRVFTRIPPEWAAKDILAWLEERLKASQSQDPEVLEFVLDGPATVERLAGLRGELAAETSRLAFLGRCEGGLQDALSALPSVDLLCWTKPLAAEFPALLAAVKERGIPMLLEAPGAKEVLALDALCQAAGVPALLSIRGTDTATLVREYRRLGADSTRSPIHLRAPGRPGELEQILEASRQIGGLLCDGIGDSSQVEGADPRRNLTLAYNILQGAGVRITKTEFVSCPSCGRTLFNLQTTTERIKAKTGHLKGVKIAIMGCIVNGPGEMADADFGYVGGAPDRINLYVGKECVEKGIPADQADQALIDLIKANGKWVDPPQA